MNSKTNEVNEQREEFNDSGDISLDNVNLYNSEEEEGVIDTNGIEIHTVTL